MTAKHTCYSDSTVDEGHIKFDGSADNVDLSIPVFHRLNQLLPGMKLH